MPSRDRSGIWTTLVTALLDGAFETPLWRTFLETLRQATRADFAILLLQPPGWPRDKVMQLIAGDATVAQSRTVYRQYFSPDEPFRRDQIAQARPYTLAELLAIDGGAHAAFFDDLVGVHGITAIREMRVEEASGVDARLTIARKGADFSADDDSLLAAIAPVLRGVLRHFVARERERLEASLAADAVGRLQVGWIALDAGGTVLAADAFGEAVLAAGDVLHRNSAGRLAAHGAALNRQIGRAIAEVATSRQARARALPLRADPWMDMLLVPAREQSFTTRIAPSVIAYVHGDNWRSTERCAQLADMFALTPSESRLALALCRGRSIPEAAAETGLTLETARSYSKLIYGKTGARGQADMVRIIMGSVLALAQDR